MKYQKIIDSLTLEEKAGLCSGKDFWHLKSVERLGLGEIMVCDGPHGLRKQNPQGNDIGLGNSVPAVCFPTAATTACSWDRELLGEMGKGLAQECLAEKVSVVLGPGANMKRSPLCGRNFEYFSEDPFLAGEMATAFINGVQSKGVGTSLKHYAVNSQEARRMTVDAVVDERALREIYLPAFETAVKNAKPWTVMCAYNRLNGEYCSENDWLQNKVLRDEWGYDGVVVSDWGAVNERVKGLANGNDLEMPSSGDYNDSKIVEAVINGELDEKLLDKAVDRLIDLILKSQKTLRDSYTVDLDANHALARKIAGQSIVLLKNEDGVLPLKKDAKVAVIGKMAKEPRYQGAGSSLINPTKKDCALKELLALGVDTVYADGYSYSKKAVEVVLIDEAVNAAKKADVALLFVGLPAEYEAEGYDRAHMKMPENQLRLIDTIAKANPNCVVVLSGGSPVEMPWLGSVKGLLNGYLGGQAGGSAVADVLTGAVNPSGKLAETYPLCLEDTPCLNNFPGNQKTVEYRESIYIGYRYYDKAAKAVAYPFGHGLSYTSFKYSALKLSAKKLRDDGELTVSFKVKNTGKIAGSETAQLYVRDVESTAFRPEKELKGFEKLHLEPGEEKTVEITLCKRAFAFYNTAIADWHVESGEFEILVGASSRDILLSARVTVESTAPDAPIPDLRATAPSYYSGDVQNVPDSEFEALLGRPIPPVKRDPHTPLGLANNLEDATDTVWGRRIVSLVNKAVHIALKDDPNAGMLEAMVTQVPIRNFVSMSMGVFSYDMAMGLLRILNGQKKMQGLGKILAGIPNALAGLKNLLHSI